jgi:hypothetical protein
VAATEIIVNEAGGKYARLVAAADPERHDVVFGKPAVVDWVLERLAVTAAPFNGRWAH